MGYSAVHQQPSLVSSGEWTEFGTVLQGIAAGYVLESGHALEVGLNFSAWTEAHVGYRYFLRIDEFAVWPFAGGGVGMELRGFALSDGTFESNAYQGRNTMLYFGGGLLMPLLDVGLKMEARLTLFGAERIVLTTGIGLLLFL
jgi:hypothetical protein